ncbi:MAG: PIN domain-containing protein [Deltaproteobacteria bacterium]|nr:PIN domain-containing protein [Deltaproteobacteria bacterium]MBI4373700.1 PIN domain-containing protein [Deltaproteobacteria bacterium]
MSVLVDTSVWIEFFRPKPPIDISPLDLLIREREVTTCRPIIAEVLSGKMSSGTRSTVSRALNALTLVDLDWNIGSSWEKVIDLASLAHQKGIGIPGLVDRMILVSAQESGNQLWTLEAKLQKLAGLAGVGLFPI